MNIAANTTAEAAVSGFEDRSVTVPKGLTSLAKFRAWTRCDSFPEHGRIAWVQGEIIIEMSPERVLSHNQVKSEIFFALTSVAKKHDLGMVFSDGVRLVHSKADVSNQPDLMFVSWDTLSRQLVRIEPREQEVEDGIEIVGSPDMVLEVLSPSSVYKDKVLMLDRYYKAGVKEYWLADARSDAVQFQILLRGSKGFQASEMEKWQVSRVFARKFRLERSRNRAGLWCFNLRSRSL